MSSFVIGIVGAEGPMENPLGGDFSQGNKRLTGPLIAPTLSIAGVGASTNNPNVERVKSPAALLGSVTITSSTIAASGLGNFNLSLLTSDPTKVVRINKCAIDELVFGGGSIESGGTGVPVEFPTIVTNLKINSSTIGQISVTNNSTLTSSGMIAFSYPDGSMVTPNSYFHIGVGVQTRSTTTPVQVGGLLAATATNRTLSTWNGYNTTSVVSLLELIPATESACRLTVAMGGAVGIVAGGQTGSMTVSGLVTSNEVLCDQFTVTGGFGLDENGLTNDTLLVENNGKFYSYNVAKMPTLSLDASGITKTISNPLVFTTSLSTQSVIFANTRVVMTSPSITLGNVVTNLAASPMTLTMLTNTTSTFGAIGTLSILSNTTISNTVNSTVTLTSESSALSISIVGENAAIHVDVFNATLSATQNLIVSIPTLSLSTLTINSANATTSVSFDQFGTNHLTLSSNTVSSDNPLNTVTFNLNTLSFQGGKLGFYDSYLTSILADSNFTFSSTRNDFAFSGVSPTTYFQSLEMRGLETITFDKSTISNTGNFSLVAPTTFNTELSIVSSGPSLTLSCSTLSGGSVVISDDDFTISRLTCATLSTTNSTHLNFVHTGVENGDLFLLFSGSGIDATTGPVTIAFTGAGFLSTSLPVVNLTMTATSNFSIPSATIGSATATGALFGDILIQSNTFSRTSIALAKPLVINGGISLFTISESTITHNAAALYINPTGNVVFKGVGGFHGGSSTVAVSVTVTGEDLVGNSLTISANSVSVTGAVSGAFNVITATLASTLPRLTLGPTCSLSLSEMYVSQMNIYVADSTFSVTTPNTTLTFSTTGTGGVSFNGGSISFTSNTITTNQNHLIFGSTVSTTGNVSFSSVGDFLIGSGVLTSVSGVNNLTVGGNLNLNNSALVCPTITASSFVITTLIYPTFTQPVGAGDHLTLSSFGTVTTPGALVLRNGATAGTNGSHSRIVNSTWATDLGDLVLSPGGSLSFLNVGGGSLVANVLSVSAFTCGSLSATGTISATTITSSGVVSATNALIGSITATTNTLSVTTLDSSFFFNSTGVGSGVELKSVGSVTSTLITNNTISTTNASPLVLDPNGLVVFGSTATFSSITTPIFTAGSVSATTLAHSGFGSAGTLTALVVNMTSLSVLKVGSWDFRTASIAGNVTDGTISVQTSGTGLLAILNGDTAGVNGTFTRISNNTISASAGNLLFSATGTTSMTNNLAMTGALTTLAATAVSVSGAITAGTGSSSGLVTFASISATHLSATLSNLIASSITLTSAGVSNGLGVLTILGNGVGGVSFRNGDAAGVGGSSTSFVNGTITTGAGNLTLSAFGSATFQTFSIGGVALFTTSLSHSTNVSATVFGGSSLSLSGVINSLTFTTNTITSAVGTDVGFLTSPGILVCGSGTFSCPILTVGGGTNITSNTLSSTATFQLKPATGNVIFAPPGAIKGSITSLALASLTINTASATAGCVVDCSSTVSGILIPIVTTAQKNLFNTTNLQGCEVFDSTLACRSFYDGSNSLWLNVLTSSYNYVTNLTTYSTNTQGGGFADLPGFVDIPINCRDTTSLVELVFAGGVSHASTPSYVHFKLQRKKGLAGAYADIAVGNARASSTRCWVEGSFGQQNSTGTPTLTANSSQLTSVHGTFVDSVSYTGDVFYKIQVNHTAGTGMIVGGTSNTSDVTSSSVPTSLFLKEIIASPISVQCITDLPNYRTTATSGGTTYLDVNGVFIQRFTGSSDQTVVLPLATSSYQGKTFKILNDSTGTLLVTIKSGSNLLRIPPSRRCHLICVSTSSDVVGAWANYMSANTTSGYLMAVSSGSQPISAGVGNAVQFGSILTDTFNSSNETLVASVSNSRFTNSSGRSMDLIVAASIRCDSATIKNFNMWIRINQAGTFYSQTLLYQPDATSADVALSCSSPLRLASTDYFEIYVFFDDAINIGSTAAKATTSVLTVAEV